MFYLLVALRFFILLSLHYCHCKIFSKFCCVGGDAFYDVQLFGSEVELAGDRCCAVMRP